MKKNLIYTKLIFMRYYNNKTIQTVQLIFSVSILLAFCSDFKFIIIIYWQNPHTDIFYDV